MLKLKKVLMVCLVSAAFLSAGRMAFADGVSGSDLLNYEISTETVQVIQKDSAEAEQVIHEDSAEAEQVIQKDSAEAEQNSEATILLSDNDDEEKPSEDDTQEEPVKILRQPEDRIFIPGVNIAFSLQAQGTGLQYQWYYKKRGQSEFKPWKNHTRSGESVAPDESWDGIELYCEVTDEKGNTVRSDTVMACIGDTKKILAVGDSICRGSRNGYRGFVGDLGLPYDNLGISGAALSTIRTDVLNIPDQMVQSEILNPDIIIVNGGMNDYTFGSPMGIIPYETTDNVDDLDIGTVMGGLQKLFITMHDKYPNAQPYFLITHKVFRNGVYLVTEPNAEGYTQQELHDALVACCNVYEIEVIDIFEDSFLDTSIGKYRSKQIYYGEDAWKNDTDYVNCDGVHPLSRGYLEGYIPIILNHVNVDQPLMDLEILDQPQSTTISLGEPVTIALNASGSFLKYQWYFKKKGQTDFRPWPNRVRATETVTPPESWDGIQLYCVVTDKRGNSIQSEIVTVKIIKKMK